MSTTTQVELGRVVITANCLATLGRKIAEGRREPFDETTHELLAQMSLQPYIARHARGDWGDVDQEDAAANEQALRDGTRLLSVYRVAGVKVYVITDGLSDACPACWAGLGVCEPEKGSRGPDGFHFRDDLPPRRLTTTVLLPEDY